MQNQCRGPVPSLQGQSPSDVLGSAPATGYLLAVQFHTGCSHTYMSAGRSLSAPVNCTFETSSDIFKLLLQKEPCRAAPKNYEIGPCSQSTGKRCTQTSPLTGNTCYSHLMILLSSANTHHAPVLQQPASSYRDLAMLLNPDLQ